MHDQSIAEVVSENKSVSPLQQFNETSIALANESFHYVLLGGDYEALKTTGFKARGDASPIRLVRPLPWKLNKDRNSTVMLHAWRFLGPIWNKLQQTKDRQYFDEAIDLIEDWNIFQASGSRISELWYDMATGLRAMHLAFLLHMARQYGFAVEQKTIAMLYQLIDLHIEKLLDENSIKGGNHAIYQIVGLRTLCLSAGKETEQNTDYCEAQLTKLLKDGFDDHSVNTENSPFYHNYNLHLIRRIDARLFPGLTDQIKKIVAEGTEVTRWLTAPDGSFYQIGDSEAQGLSLKSVARRDLQKNGITYVHKDMSESGYIVIRSHPVTDVHKCMAFVMHATNKSYIHAHADQLSFLFFYNGTELLADSGKYTYQNDDWRQYFVSDLAHNTVGLAGMAFGPTTVPLNTSALKPVRFKDGQYTVEGWAIKGGGQLLHTRRIRIDPGVEIDITDTVVNRTTNPVEARFHFGVDIDAYIAGKEVVLSKNGERIAVIKFDKNAEATIKRGLDGDEIQGWISKKYHQKSPANVLCLTFAPDTSSFLTKIVLQ